MEMNQVRYFTVLCETMNFTRAAQRCNVSQPSLTRAIQLLEHGLGGPLFNRERGNTHLTELGAVLRPHLAEVLAQAEAARARASSLFTLSAARLKVGLGRGVAFDHLGAALRRFASLHPDTEIHLLAPPPGATREAFRRGDLELALQPDRPHDIDDLHYYPIGTDRPQLLVRPDHRFAGPTRATLAAVSAEGLIVSDGCPFFAAIDRQLSGRGLSASVRITVADAAWFPSLVRNGLGIAVTGLRHGVAAGLVGCLIDDLAGVGNVYLATKRGRRYSPAVKAFLDLVLKAPRAEPEAGAA